MTDLRKIIIDGEEIEVDPRLTLLQACEEAGIEVPRFCYHERLSIAGNCRMCLVEVVGGPPKPTASCAVQVKDMRPGKDGEPPEVRTKSPMVKKAREGVMEFLLINHPLDCPICDQGGECDLQDQAMAYGVDFSRYREPKRAALDPDLGPLVDTQMTRCISCTRCVRFITEVAGVPEMGQTGRGEDSEITSYLGAMLTSEMQGNVIDLCPVGALTSKPYAFTARPWELKKTESIDVMDALGSNIRVDTKGREVMRILPRNHDGVNEEWLSDRSRFIWDGLRRQRLDKPYVRRDGKLAPATWGEAFKAVAEAMKGKKVAALAGDLAPAEAVYALRELVRGMGGTTECRTDGGHLPAGNRSGYVGTATIEDIEDARQILLIGTNPRSEMPVLNARIRKAWMRGAEVGLVGQPVDLTYPVTHLGTDRAALSKLIEREYGTILDEPSVVIVGAERSARRGWRGGAGRGHGADGKDEIGPAGAARGRRPGRRDGSGLHDRGRDRRGARRRRGGLEPRGGRDRDPGGSVRDLSGQPRRPGRAPRRRDPARSGLDRGIGHFRQYRGTAADGQPRRVPAGRRQGELVDPARGVGGTWGDASVQFARRVARGDDRRGPASGSDRRGAGKRMDARARGVYDAGGIRDRRDGSLPDQPDRPGEPGDGRTWPGWRKSGRDPWRRSRGAWKVTSTPERACSS